MEAIGGGNAAASGAGSAATASASSIVGPSGLTGRVGAASAVTSEAEGASADNDADDSVEETGITEEDDEEDEDEAEGKARTDSVSSTGASASKSSGSKHQSPGKMKKRVRLGESEEDPQESTADEDEDDEDDEVADDEDDYEEDEDDDKASAMDVDEDEDDEDDAEDAGRVDVSDSASMLRMVRSLSEEEARRHEQFRRSHFERGAVKRVSTNNWLGATQPWIHGRTIADWRLLLLHDVVHGAGDPGGVGRRPQGAECDERHGDRHGRHDQSVCRRDHCRRYYY